MKTWRGVCRSAPLCILLLAACESGGGGTTGFATRDSAGIQIVENTAPQWKEGEGWTLNAEPSVDIGLVDGPLEYQLSRVGAALRLASGQIAVSNGGSQEIRFYDAAGTYLRAVGGNGGGPGEFQGLTWIRALPGDSLLAYDDRARRLSTYDSTSALVGSNTLTFNDQTGHPRVVERFPDGTLLVQTGQVYGAGKETSGAKRDSAHYFRTSSDGSRINTVMGLRGAEAFIRADAKSMTVTTLVFGRSSAYSLAGDHVFAAETDTYEIRQYTPEGTLVRLIRRRHEPRPVTDADVRELKQRRMDGIDNPAFRTQIEGMMAEMPIPSTMPAFSTLRADDAGNLWVQEYPGVDPDAPTQWTVFDPEGRMLGGLSMPGRFRAMQIGSDFVLGVWKDDLDVEHVRLYRLEKPS